MSTSLRLPAALAAVFLMGTASPVNALTLLEAVDLALARSPEVAGLTSQIEVQRAREELAGRAGQPQIGIDGGIGGQYSNLFGRGPSTQIRRDLGGRVSQRLWDWQRTGLTVEAAARRTEVSALEVDLARERLALLTSEAYLNALRRTLILKQSQENITYHRWLVDVARERVAKNQLAKARLTELQARLSPLTLDKIENEAELSRARLTLVELAGSASDLVMPPALPSDLRNVANADAIVARAIAGHPAIKRSTLLIDAAEKGLAAAKAAYWPAVDANLSSRYLEDAEGLRGLQWDNQAMLRLNWNLFGEGVPSQVREAEASRIVAEAQRAQARQEVTLDVRRYATTLQALKDQQKVLEEYQLAARFSMDAGMEYLKRTARFATDMLALADLINVRYQAETIVISNRIDQQIAELRLQHAAGRLRATLDRAYRK